MSADETSAVPRGTGKAGGWTGFDLDGTLAYYDKWRGIAHIGKPVGADNPRAAFSVVKQMIAAGEDVRIFTARAAQGPVAVKYVEEWCRVNLGKVLPVTNTKDMAMIALWDDRAVQVGKNTGIPMHPMQWED